MKFIKEFKEFAMKGNVIDMAVGVVIGATFSAIVTSLVNDIFMPFLSWITGGLDIASLSVTVGEGEYAAHLAYGSFINAIINFILIALVLFIFVKSINKMRSRVKKPDAPKEPARLCPYCKSEIAKDATRCPHCTSQLN